MIDLSLYPTYSRYRSLTYFGPHDPPQRGHDVYALQHAINFVARIELVPDGVLGPVTGAAIEPAQEAVGFTGDAVDGECGGVTWRAICRRIIARQKAGRDFYPGLPMKQANQESGCLGGNYSDSRDDADAEQGWSYDMGLMQLNSAHHGPQIGFNPPAAVDLYLAQLDHYYKLYEDTSLFLGPDKSDYRRWALAAGSWNAWAWTNTLAGVKPNAGSLSTLESLHIETYMRDVMPRRPKES